MILISVKLFFYEKQVWYTNTQVFQFHLFLSFAIQVIAALKVQKHINTATRNMNWSNKSSLYNVQGEQTQKRFEKGGGGECRGLFQVPATFAIHEKYILRENNVENTLQIILIRYSLDFFSLQNHKYCSAGCRYARLITGFES